MIKKWKSGDSMSKKERIYEFLEKNSLDGFFIGKDENCRYLSEFTGSDSYLFLTKHGLYLLTDSRYTEQAKKEVVDFEVINHEGKLPEKISTFAYHEGMKIIGVEAGFTYKNYLAFKKYMPDVEFVFSDIDSLRQIKSEEELDYMREVCRISDVGFEKTLPYIKAGMTEAEARTILECAMLEAGSEGKSFDTIVASGIRSSYPHGIATDKVIEEGDLVTFDFGAIYKGYHSDITRTIAVGDISEDKRRMYEAVYECQAHIEKILRSGLICSDVDKEARDFLKRYELDTYFTHALGHGVGLEVHEGPVLAPRDHSALQVNMIETVEPGVYIPGVGGVRIEDTVIIRKDSIEVLTKYPKKFIRV